MVTATQTINTPQSIPAWMEAMRRTQAPVAVALLSLLLVAAGLAWGLPTPPPLQTDPLQRSPVQLPAPGQDVDGDSYADDVDQAHGDLYAAVRIEEAPTDHVALGTDDDQWRFGRDRELAWRHVVDVAPGIEPGSRAWREANLRTGVWMHRMDPEGRTLVLNVRDDAPAVLLELEAWRGERRVAGLSVTVRSDGNATFFDSQGFRGTAWVLAGPTPGEQRDIAARWAPTYHFDSAELFFPVPVEVMATIDGFHPRTPVLAPWDRAFNNGRDGYRLLRDDYDGDGVVTSRDIDARLQGVRSLGIVRPTVYAHVAVADDLQIVVQYWSISFYNYVLDRRGQEVPELAHAGDREFIQVRFPDLAAAKGGDRPATVAYSQHYSGVVMEGTTEVPAVYVARGSHASYPVPGDDRRVRPALGGYYDRFDGAGATWQRGDYTLEAVGGQAWHLENIWGPATRHSRDLGTTTRPLLRHDFVYPFQDPSGWELGLPTLEPDEALDTYGGSG